MRGFFNKQAPKLARQVAALYKKHVGKASGDDKAAAERIASDLDFQWMAIREPMEDALAQAYLDAGDRALTELGINDQAMFDQVNEDAAAFAKSRAAELIGKKWVAGKLEDNPDARWAITESTRDKIRALVLDALTSGASVDEVAGMIEESAAFSALRAEMVARTELAFAHIQGNIAGWTDSGVVAGYEWVLGSEHEIEDECDDNEGEFAPIGGTFPSGDQGPPLHPNCVCALLPRLIEEDVEEE